MNTATFASELNTDGRTARKFLRSITPAENQPGKGSRWELPETKRELNKLKKQFANWKAEQDKPKPEAEVQADEVKVEDQVEVTDED